MTRFGSSAACLVLAAAAATLAFAPTAKATPINYDFTVNVTSGPLLGTVENGSFSYDSSSILPGSKNAASGLLTALDFTFNGIVYTASTANTGWLTFDSAGALTAFAFGNKCTAGQCQASARADEWYVMSPGNFFAYSVSAFGGVSFGNLTFAHAGTPVPEPAALGMFGLGALLIGGFITLRRRAPRQAW